MGTIGRIPEISLIEYLAESNASDVPLGNLRLLELIASADVVAPHYHEVPHLGLNRTPSGKQ